MSREAINEIMNKNPKQIQKENQAREKEEKEKQLESQVDTREKYMWIINWWLFEDLDIHLVLDYL